MVKIARFFSCKLPRGVGDFKESVCDYIFKELRSVSSVITNNTEGKREIKYSKSVKLLPHSVEPDSQRRYSTDAREISI
jgi:hypothetical protein